MSEIEREIYKQTEALYQKKAGDLVFGTVPQDRYQWHSAYLQALRDVMKIMLDVRKKANEDKSRAVRSGEGYQV
jgi:hypothetical protein